MNQLRERNSGMFNLMWSSLKGTPIKTYKRFLGFMVMVSSLSLLIFLYFHLNYLLPYKNLVGVFLSLFVLWGARKIALKYIKLLYPNIRK